MLRTIGQFKFQMLGWHQYASMNDICFMHAKRFKEMDVSENSGTPKSSILTGFSIINHPFWVPLFLETPKWHD